MDQESWVIFTYIVATENEIFLEKGEPGVKFSVSKRKNRKISN